MWAVILFNALSKREQFDPSFTLAAVLLTVALGLLAAGGTGLMRLAAWGRLLTPLALLVFFGVTGYISAKLLPLHHIPLTALIPFGVIGLVIILAAIFVLTRPYIVAAFVGR
jgi:hypothetical protein